MSVNSQGFVQTKSSLLKQKAAEKFQAVKYEAHKPKAKKLKIGVEDETSVTESMKPNSKTNELDMKKTRYEVIKFGMSGFDPEKKEEAKIQLAIKLGAKPPKNKFKNYKQLREDKKKQLHEQKERIEFQQLGKNQLGKSTSKGKFFKKKKEKSGLLEKYGKPSTKDVMKFKNNK